jgi:TetR/AcrR family transcriptional regulator, regulator of cefoperazone and chloramphenicol sensitivity
LKTYSTSERTKQVLVGAAGELLAERGVGRVSTRAIAERAGENIGTIHYHFGSKDGLLKEVLLFACHSQVGPTLQELVKAHEDRLGDVEGQVEAVRALIRHLMRETFSPERPRWCSRALYHVAQHSGSLRNFLREEMMDPLFDAVTHLVHRIRPDWTAHAANVWWHMAIGSVVFHADHSEIVLERLGSEMYPADYLANLEQRIVGDALRALGLPTETN